LALYSFPIDAEAQICGGALSTDSDDIWECIEYQDGISNMYYIGPVGVWFVPGGTDAYSDTFTFETDLTLNYSFIIAQCYTTFEIHFRRNNDNSISIRIVDADVHGNGLCANIGLENFTWYASDKTSFSNTSSVDGAGSPGDIHPRDTGATRVNLGNLKVILLGSPVCTGYLADVDFYNGSAITTPTSIQFSTTMFATACSMKATLKTIANQDINAC